MRLFFFCMFCMYVSGPTTTSGPTATSQPPEDCGTFFEGEDCKKGRDQFFFSKINLLCENIMLVIVFSRF